MTPAEVDALLPYCTTDRQRETLEACRNVTYPVASKSLGIAKRNVERSIHLIRTRAALQGYSPQHDMTRTVPDGYTVRGVSTYYNRDGQATGQWVKSRADDERRAELIAEWIDRLADDVKPLPPVKPPKDSDSELLAVIPMGDPHFGMFAWAKESGDDFDLSIADRLQRAVIDRLVSLSPPAAECLLINLGDFFHADDSTNATPGSGHALDVDTRFDKIMDVAEDCMIYCVHRLLEKFQTVHFWSMPGNHDPHAGSPLARILRAYFRENPRVKIDVKPGKFNYMRFGKVLIGSTHGDMAKPQDLPLLMATDKAQDWGKSSFRYWYVGHVHHKTVKEHPGCIVETCRTLAPRDAWHAGMGYRAGRDMQLIVHHREFGETVRIRCDHSMVTI